MTCLFSPSASVFLFLFSVFCSLLKNTPVCISRSVLFGLCAASCSCVCVCVYTVYIHFINSENFYIGCKCIPSVSLSLLCFFHFVSKNHSEALFNHVTIKTKPVEKFTHHASWQIITWLSILFIYLFKFFKNLFLIGG